MSWILYVYIFCAAIGLFWAVLSGLMSGFFGGDIDGGGADIDVGGPDMAIGDIDVPDADIDISAVPDTGAVHFSPLSPVTVSMFLVSFGGAGAIAEYFYNLPISMSLPVAVVAGIAVGGITFFLFYKIYESVQGSSEARAADLPGSEAEVIVAIPPGGTGKVAYTLRGSRYTSPAKCATDKTIEQGEVVVIDKVVGVIAFVTPGEAP